MATLTGLVETVTQLQQQVQTLEHRLNWEQSHSSNYNRFDLELTSIPHWYRNSPIFKQPYKANANHHHMSAPVPNKPKNKVNAPHKGRKIKQAQHGPDITDNQETQLGVSSELMNFFYNGQIRRNRLRIEKMEQEKADIESLPTMKQQQILESQRRNKVYGKPNNYKLKQKEIAIDAHFMKTLQNTTTHQKQRLVTWPATPLSYH